MADKAAKSSIPNATTTSANKDLSCLRCRKKKAKCSKTRPTCTRCSRSNQPCEYPDAPPNLPDLSQKVLSLYDTLKELEGEFLVKYMQDQDQDQEEEEEEEEEEAIGIAIDFKQEHDDSLLQHVDQNNTMEPAGWSMSLTPHGLSIQAVTRNLSEFSEFAKMISRQIIRDFGPDYLPKLWDSDAEGYFQEESDAEELEEDEYLVTVPVFSTCSLLFTQDNTIVEKQPSCRNGTDALIQSHFPHMMTHLDSRYQSLEKSNAPHHVIILMLQLKCFLPPLTSSQDALTQICILTAYVVSVTLLGPISPPMSFDHDCADYATMLLIDLILTKGDDIPPYPVILCAILLAWIDTELCCSKADVLIHVALRILCGSDWKSEASAWQILIASLLYLDIYSATFRFKRPQLRGEEGGVYALWKAIVVEPTKRSYLEVGIILEAKLMSLLNKVISLFYKEEEDDDDDKEQQVRKIDVDEVLTLIRDVELWEQELPEWAKWESNEELEIKMHLHLIHNVVKILLFKPFTKQDEQQTFTKITFLDMSINSADRLSICLLNVHVISNWTKAAKKLILDVTKRVLNMFDKDEDVVNQLEKIHSRLIG